MTALQDLLRSLALGATVALAATGLAAPAAAQDLKVVTTPRPAQFSSLDPVKQLDDASTTLVRMVYSTLLRYAYLERPFKLEPDLLERMPELSADKLTYTLRLRKGVRFHDNACFPGGQGRELVADDVLYSLRRFADARLNTQSWFMMEGAVVGLDAFRAASAKPGAAADLSSVDIAGLKTIDSHTLTIRLTKPNPLFLFALAAPPASIVPREAVQTYQARFDVHPVGTGPFTLKDVDRKGVLRLLKNPSYHGTYPTAGAPGDAEKGLLKDAGKRLPLVDVVEMPLIEEAQPRMLKMLKGELDWVTIDPSNFTKMVVRGADGTLRLNDTYAPKLNLFAVPAPIVSFTTINMKDPLLGGNRLLRQAIARLVDTEAVIKVLLNGRGIPLNSLVPLDLAGSERDTGARFPRHDLAEARRLLAEAGHPGARACHR
jgi:ABC-type transport system substrate-binding protein